MYVPMEKKLWWCLFFDFVRNISDCRYDQYSSDDQENNIHGLVIILRTSISQILDVLNSGADVNKTKRVRNHAQV